MLWEAEHEDARRDCESESRKILNDNSREIWYRRRSQRGSEHTRVETRRVSSPTEVANCLRARRGCKDRRELVSMGGGGGTGKRRRDSRCSRSTVADTSIPSADVALRKDETRRSTLVLEPEVRSARIYSRMGKTSRDTVLSFSIRRYRVLTSSRRTTLTLALAPARLSFRSRLSLAAHNHFGIDPSAFPVRCRCTIRRDDSISLQNLPITLCVGPRSVASRAK